ncbi:MAG: AbrB/MazE/SpoVT family DNA-binding domain-containing protein [Deltaproteobacteria bacterium]|nr:AbrB/MazE/SpoVT family DNA-binding domain-containing protein [Deltaproteobacteria bacterium]
MEVVNVSPKGQILIPKALREKHGVRPGSKVQIIESQNGLFVKPAPEDPIEAACGFLKGDFSLTKDLMNEHRKELENE